MRIVFMGTPDFAVPALVALHEAGHEIACVYTQPPSRSGRGKKLRPSPVQAKAEEFGFEVRSPKSLRSDEAKAEFASLNADIAVVAAYGLILPQAVLDAPQHGCVNIHASILPRWRGAAPIHRAIMAGDEETGVTIMQMEAGLDTGPMRHIVTTPIGAKTTGEMFAELGDMGASAMVEVLSNLDAYPPVAQADSQATHAAKIDKAEARIDWSRPARVLVRHVAGLAPFPGAWFEIGDERVKLLLAEVALPREGGDPGDFGTAGALDPRLRGGAVAGTVIDNDLTIVCGEGALSPLKLQRAGKPAMSREDFLRGRPIEPGTVLK